jgi:hypothetical protein
LNRANGHVDYNQLVVHTLPPGHSSGSLAGLPDFGYVSQLSLSGGSYPTLTPALATSGLQNPDAIMGAVPMGSMTAVVYVEKRLGHFFSFIAAKGIAGTIRPLPEREQERFTRLRRPRPKWP